MKTIGIIGGGAWGTALAHMQASAGRKVTLWARENAVVEGINARRENSAYLPDIRLHDGIVATGDLAEAARADILLIVTPAQYMRASLQDIKPHLKAGVILVLCSKGIEIESGKLLSQVATEVLPDQDIAVMTGPTFAAEIARGMPSAVTLAAKTEEIAKIVQESVGVKNFRPYTITDMIGAQLGGAIKNVVAIACGVAEGRKMGDNARAALMTRGVAEIGRLCAAMGGKRETLLGMCGVGDMTLTCGSMQSRNFSLGHALGEGKTLQEILQSRQSVTEGIHTAQAALVLAKRNAVEMPVCQAVHDVLSGVLTVEQGIEALLSRPFR